tara:strand:+ start:2121 stop:2285 length:165 start_codon:yes stop_codon:yes gene_type:complete
MAEQTLETKADTSEIVKCGFCSASLKKSDAYKSPDKNHDFYYCDESHYKLITEN